ncbi:unnamed protein product [Leptidea sinapis]|uniref:Microsomal glutathione S-transferase 1 n=1 Tax=Leptidea sinapis TaxID=189913 RepID=A0A5E4QSG6_9NEOP|nr:unnamed protein product [Leptidea sinapis]
MESNSILLQSYFLYSAILALKLLLLAPLTSLLCRPEKVQRANISDLKNLTPFWLVAALYTTTSPDTQTAVNLFRLFVIARLVTVLGYIIKLPKVCIEAAFTVSITVTSYMAGYVVYAYRKAL